MYQISPRQSPYFISSPQSTKYLNVTKQYEIEIKFVFDEWFLKFYFLVYIYRTSCLKYTQFIHVLSNVLL